jgi:hypothetical protein
MTGRALAKDKYSIIHTHWKLQTRYESRKLPESFYIRGYLLELILKNMVIWIFILFFKIC